METKRPFVEIAKRHVGAEMIVAFGRVWRFSDFIGHVIPTDVGKRVYLVGDILQVENDEQRDNATSD